MVKFLSIVSGRKFFAVLFICIFFLGQLLSELSDDNKVLMQLYALLLTFSSVIPLIRRSFYKPTMLLSGHSMVLFAPIWFLYLEAILPNGDAWLLPASSVINALSLCAFFLFVFNLAYVFKMPAWAVRFHTKYFEKQLSPNLIPLLGIGFTLLLLFVIWGYYDFDISKATEAYLGGRSTGSGGLIKRGGVGGWEVFLQPFAFMAPVVPTLASLSWVSFGGSKKSSLLLRVLVLICSLFLLFLLFLGGSRGNMAIYLVGPASVWFLFGKRLPPPVFFLVTLLSFLLVIGVWQYQVKTRSNLLDGLNSLDSFTSQTSFNPAETHRDNNLYLFTLNVMYMPKPYPFEGYSEFAFMLINPIPRALWPGKPLGIQESATTFQTAKGPATMGPIRFGTASLSASIVSDGFKMNHYFGISLYALILAIMASLWDRLAQPRLQIYNLFFILNAAWIFWILWSFRSSFAWISGMYSVWGAYLFAYFSSRFFRTTRLP